MIHATAAAKPFAAQFVRELQGARLEAQRPADSADRPMASATTIIYNSAATNASGHMTRQIAAARAAQSAQSEAIMRAAIYERSEQRAESEGARLLDRNHAGPTAMARGQGHHVEGPREMARMELRQASNDAGVEKRAETERIRDWVVAEKDKAYDQQRAQQAYDAARAASQATADRRGGTELFV